MKKTLRVLITAGPTREPIDPIRFISNRSSGKMGYALAETSIHLGYPTTLISGPVAIPPPTKARFLQVETAKEMLQTTLREFPKHDLIIMAAAVADYESVSLKKNKIKKNSPTLTLHFKKTPDILKKLGKLKRKSQILVGFAAETQNLIQNARKKLRLKQLDLVLANRVGLPGVGFESNDNQITLVYPSLKTRKLPKMNKRKLSNFLFQSIFSKLIF